MEFPGGIKEIQLASQIVGILGFKKEVFKGSWFLEYTYVDRQIDRQMEGRLVGGKVVGGLISIFSILMANKKFDRQKQLLESLAISKDI